MENVIVLNDPKQINEEAADWLIRLDGDTPLSASEVETLVAWMNRSPVHRDKLHQLAQMWDKLNILTELAVPLNQRTKTPSASGWRLFSGGGEARGEGVLAMPSSVMAMAATLVVTVALLFATGVFSVALDKTNGRYSTAIGKQQSLPLADGSQLILNTGSTIDVRFNDQYRDIILLQGEVHFDVAKNKEKPFRVFAGKGRVQAVGTAFTVYRVNNQAVDVTVTEGKVALASVEQTSLASPSDPVPANPPAENLGTLMAGQGASISTDKNPEGSAVLDNVAIYTEEELQRRLAWHKGMLLFSGEPLAEVVEKISRYTELEIIIPQQKVRAIAVGGQFPVGDTESMLDVLEATFALNIERGAQGRITIRSLN